MQGQRGAIGSLPETLGFDHGSTSNDPVIDPQICWNNMRNTSQNDTSITYINSVNQEGPSLSGWNIGEPSSSGTQNQIVHNERKIEHNWLSSMNDCNGADPIFEDRQYELTNNLSLNNANNLNISDSVPQDLNMSSGFVGPNVDDNQEMDIPNPYKASSSENLPIPSPDSMPDYLVEENEGRRLSCKRKALEGQASGSGSSSYFHRGEGSVWHPGYANRNGNSSFNISEVNPRLGLGVGGVVTESRPNAAVQSVEASRRNLRLRINASSNQQDSIIPTKNNTFSSPHHLLRLHPLNNLDLAAPPPLPPPPAADTAIPQGPRRNLQSSRWNRGSSSRSGGSSGGFLDSPAHEEANSRTIPRNISEHPMFVPPAQSLVNWSFNNGGNMSVNGNGNGASSSRAGPSSGVHPSVAAGPNWVPHHRNTSHYPRRLRELVHRSLMASAASESGGQNGNFTAPSSQELPPSSGDLGRHVSHSRSAMLLDRQLEGTFGIPYSMRTLAAAGEGRSRLVSEHIRNVLDIMHRGEGLRFEDVMILDQSVFFGMADIHDRHRDMRLDVDNMSYEELLALEERIGNVNTGLSEEIISTRLKQRKYVFISTGLVKAEPCCVCQEEYNNGEDLGTLDCGHDFHSECIKQWLTCKNLCPICKTTALIT